MLRIKISSAKLLSRKGVFLICVSKTAFSEGK